MEEDIVGKVGKLQRYQLCDVIACDNIFEYHDYNMYILANWNWWCIEIRQWMGILNLLLLNWLCTQNKIYWRMPFERCKFKWLIHNSLRRYTEKRRLVEGPGDAWWALQWWDFWIFSTKLLRRSWRVDCSTPSGSAQRRTGKSGSGSDSSRSNSKWRNWMNLDEIVCFGPSGRKHCKKGMERMTTVFTNGLCSIYMLWLCYVCANTTSWRRQKKPRSAIQWALIACIALY